MDHASGVRRLRGHLRAGPEFVGPQRRLPGETLLAARRGRSLDPDEGLTLAAVVARGLALPAAEEWIDGAPVGGPDTMVVLKDVDIPCGALKRAGTRQGQEGLRVGHPPPSFHARPRGSPEVHHGDHDAGEGDALVVADKNGMVTDPVGFHSTGADGPHEGWFAACVAWAMDVAQPARTVIWKQCELRPTDSEDGPGTVVPPDPFYADQSYRT